MRRVIYSWEKKKIWENDRNINRNLKRKTKMRAPVIK